MKNLLNPLDTVLYRAKKRGKVNIAFFGGSITWGGNCGDIENKSYRALTGKFIREMLPGVKVNCFNGGFGGTNSMEGVFRCEEHILSHKPDLVFMEFAINDLGVGNQMTNLSCLEANFRKIWKKDPATGIILLISGSRNDSQVQLIHLKAAADFGLHCIDVGAAKRKMILKGKYTNEQLWSDNVHPGIEGHAVYAGIVKKYLKKLLKEARKRENKYKPPKEYVYWRAREFINARYVPATEGKTGGSGWHVEEDHHKKFDGVYPDTSTWPDRTTWPFPYRKGLVCTEKAGDSFTFSTKMYWAGIAVDYPGGANVFDVYVDGEKVTEFSREVNFGRFPRVPMVSCSNAMDGKEHEVKIVLRKGALKIGYYMVS